MNPVLKPNDNRRALVVGLGLTGHSCVRHLVARGYAVRGVDTRPEPPELEKLKREFPQVELHTGGLPARLFDDPGLLVVSPGISLKEPAIARAIERGAQAVGDIELFARAATAPVLAVTGANGKSTVTALTGEMCRAAGLKTAVGGNIGVPALELLEAPAPVDSRNGGGRTSSGDCMDAGGRATHGAVAGTAVEVYVLELSSFQLETTFSLNARAATVLNLSPDHMDRYRDMNEYGVAKARVFRGNGTLVLNADDPRVTRLAEPGRRIVYFGLGAPVATADYGVRVEGGEEWLARGEQLLMPAREVLLAGRHNLANVLAAMALAETVGVPGAAQMAAARNFRGLPHRTELVAEKHGVRWINDSKGTNVGATVAALNGMMSPAVLIAGGDGKGQDFHELRGAVVAHARAVVLIGRDAPLIEAALGMAVPVHHARDLRAAVTIARRLAQPGDAVLLSPACASFDMFHNYEHRGDVFRAAVQEFLA